MSGAADGPRLVAVCVPDVPCRFAFEVWSDAEADGVVRAVERDFGARAVWVVLGRDRRGRAVPTAASARQTTDVPVLVLTGGQAEGDGA